jgi:exopolyphosphatase/guanosine-5'-triphosphate,3'-diphosphate pyrophosphatase
VEHGERVFLAAAIHARYAGRLDDPCLAPAIDLLAADARRRAQILGRATLLGYRLSGGVPEMLESARLQVTAERVRLEVGRMARAPDSEVVRDRLELLAVAAGARRVELVERP